MARTNRSELEDLLAVIRTMTGDNTLALNRYQPGDSRTPWKIVGGPHGGREPFGARRRSAGEMADVMRFAIAVYSYAIGDPTAV